ncbi:MAG: CDP-alcohol phosphatidyltransferase family protein [Myxococcota bacterium]
MTQHTATAAPGLPPLRTLLKSRDVEDPVNIWFHRPLAYAFVAATWRTSITPNQITLLATVVGVLAGVGFVCGTSACMMAGGILLWTAAILDGADGLAARARGIQSQYGRAVDGAADAIVAGATVFAAIYHLAFTDAGTTTDVIVAVPAVLMTLVHLALYDFYKESYMRMTRPGAGGEAECADAVEDRARDLHLEPLPVRIAVRLILIPYMRQQEKLISWLDPLARIRETLPPTTARTAHIWRRHHLGPMKLWAAVSLAPHSYLFAMFAMADRIDAYLWVRLTVMNVLFLAALMWQRRATARAVAELRHEGVIPADAEVA